MFIVVWHFPVLETMCSMLCGAYSFHADFIQGQKLGLELGEHEAGVTWQ